MAVKTDNKWKWIAIVSGLLGIAGSLSGQCGILNNPWEEAAHAKKVAYRARQAADDAGETAKDAKECCEQQQQEQTELLRKLADKLL